MVAGARFCDAVIGRPLETAHRQVTAWGRRDGVPSRDFERRASKNLETISAPAPLSPQAFATYTSNTQPMKQMRPQSPFGNAFQAARPSAVGLTASHMTMCQASSAVEHDAVATVLIIGASRGIGLETVTAGLE